MYVILLMLQYFVVSRCYVRFMRPSNELDRSSNVAQIQQLWFVNLQRYSLITMRCLWRRDNEHMSIGRTQLGLALK